MIMKMDRLTTLVILFNILWINSAASVYADENGLSKPRPYIIAQADGTGQSVPNNNDAPKTNDNNHSDQNAETITADDIVEKSLQAYGNKERLNAFSNDAQFVGSIETAEDNWAKKAYKHVRRTPAWRTDIEQQSDQTKGAVISSTVYDGTNFSTATGTQITTLGPEQARAAADQADRQPFLLACWQNPSYHFQLLGETNYKHIPAYVIEITYKSLTPTLIYLDKSNYLVCAIAFQSWRLVDNSDELKKVTVIKEYTENRPVLNSIWPFKETVLINKKPVSTIELSSISSADDIAPDYFCPENAQLQAAPNRPRLAAPIVVPFEYCENEIVCRGKIDNIEPLWFLIDTGSSDTVSSIARLPPNVCCLVMVIFVFLLFVAMSQPKPHLLTDSN